MIDLKSIIYQKLSGSSAITDIVSDNIHFFADDTEEMEKFDERLPQVTFARIAWVVSKVRVRNETYQISSWWKDPVSSETLSWKVIELFDQTHDTNYRSCEVQLVNDSYDKDTKAHGVHVTLRFGLYDPTY